MIPQVQCAENRDSPGAKTVDVATGAVHQQDYPEGTADFTATVHGHER